MTHVFGLAQLLGRPGADELVRHGVAALDRRAAARRRARRLAGEHGRRHEGRLRARVRDARRFDRRDRPASTGGRRAARATALDVWQDRFWDDARGHGRRAVGPRAGRRLDDYRGAQRQHARRRGVAGRRRRAARRPTRPASGGCASQALRTTERVVHGWARERDWRLPEHFTADWTPLPDYNRDRPADPFRPYGVTVGHQFEWARLALHLRAVTADAARPGCSTTPTGLFDAAATRGWAADGHDGLPVHARLGRPAGRRRPHALGAVRGDRGGDGAGRGHRRRRATAISGRALAGARRGGCFADPATGNWHHELTPDRRGRPPAPGPGSPTPTTWPRCCCSTAVRCGGASPPLADPISRRAALSRPGSMARRSPG